MKRKYVSMKKSMYLTMLVLVLSFVGCTNENVVVDEKEQKETIDMEKEVEVEQDTEENEKIKLVIYCPNDAADGVASEVVECDELNAESVWNVLKDKGVISEVAILNSLEQEEKNLELDVNEEFGNQLRSYGSTGEMLLMQSVVNTYLDAYGCEQIRITENGEVLCSGHQEYVDYLTKYE